MTYDNANRPIETVTTVAVNSSDRPLEARTNHTATLARLNREYTELFDRYENLLKDAERKDREAENLRSSATGLKPKVDALRARIVEMLGADR
jgi:chromosome segregation ATPase